MTPRRCALWILATAVGLSAAALVAPRRVSTTIPSLDAQGKRGGALTATDIMIVVNGKGGLVQQLKKDLAKSPADDKSWAAVRAKAAVVAHLSTALARTQPAKGSSGSWSKYVREYAADTKKLAAATTANKHSAAKSALSAIGRSCRGCHKAHR